MLGDITLPKHFVKKVFITSKLSPLSMRIAIYLVKEIGFSEYKYLPRRLNMAKIFKVSKTAITDSLHQLLEYGILLQDSEGESVENKRSFSGTFKLCNEVELAFYDKYSLEEILADPTLKKELIKRIIID